MVLRRGSLWRPGQDPVRAAAAFKKRRGFPAGFHLGYQRVPRALLMKIAKAPPVEVKHHDGGEDFVPVLQAGSIRGIVTGIIAGTGEDQRIGRYMTVQTIQLKGNITLLSTGTPANSSDIVRLLVIHDKQANGGLPSVTSVLRAALYDAYMNLDQAKRYTVLWNMIVPMNATCAVGASAGQHESYFNFYKKVKIRITYNADLGAITEITESNIFILAISSRGLARMCLTTRLRFTG